ncbi:hypothetical protein [Nitrosarchaeum sp.]|uniref:hypothetical protein n=1 Tax=Nitrosarchaeum sp. TaxID=2026886 RepID=UPI00247C540F|nr:hypothetical protein [Nitrosarchaeum sp.]MCV0412133.1 hypothetical protein [Nitrosarchaeum sp.]
MKYVKLFSALAIIMAVAISPTIGAFAQTDVNADVSITAEKSDKQIYKEKQQQVREQIKEQRQDLKSKLTDLQNLRNDRLSAHAEIDVVPSLEFTGKVSGWAVIGGQAVPATFDLSGEAGKIGPRGWKIIGTATAEIGDRDITFDLQGHARGNHVSLKGTTNEFDNVVIHLNGYFAPVSDDTGSFALAFHRSAIINEQAQIRIPLILVGQVNTTPIGDTLPPVVESVDISSELTALFN